MLCYSVDLHSQCALIENSLATLNNLCEEADLEKAKQSEINKLNAYDYQKKKQLEAYSGLCWGVVVDTVELALW